MHHNSETRMLTKTRVHLAKPLRMPRKLFDGGGLYLLVAPTGGRYWRYNYRYQGKQKTLGLGTYPIVRLEVARARHQEARRRLAAGIDPSLCRREIRKVALTSPSD